MNILQKLEFLGSMTLNEIAEQFDDPVAELTLRVAEFREALEEARRKQSQLDADLAAYDEADAAITEQIESHERTAKKYVGKREDVALQHLEEAERLKEQITAPAGLWEERQKLAAHLDAVEKKLRELTIALQRLQAASDLVEQKQLLHKMADEEKDAAEAMEEAERDQAVADARLEIDGEVVPDPDNAASRAAARLAQLKGQKKSN